MKILILTTHFNTGGITSYVLTLSEALVGAGHQVWVASSGGDAVARLQAAGVRHAAINIRTKSEIHPKVWMSIEPVTRLVREEGIDIIHAQTRVTQVLGSFVSRFTSVSMVSTCHGFFRPRWFRKAFPCWGSAVIAISKPVARHLKEDFKVPESKVHLIANGIDLKKFQMAAEGMRQESRQRYALGNDALIGVIARLSDVKGIDQLIKAMPLVLKEVPEANLLIAGQGPQELELRKLTDLLGLKACVHFKDTVNQTQELLHAFDVFVMPSMMEGLGLSVIEAQACGIPVVASRVGGLIDLIEDGKSGYLVAPKDTAALADRIVRVLKDKQGARAMVLAARQNIEEHFSAQQMLQGTFKFYEQYLRR